jgi:DNA polymerase-3 subunit gamma/tau
MRDGQSLLEQIIAFSGKNISDDDLLEVLGVIDRQALLDTAAAILSGNAVRCLEIVESLHLHGHDLRCFCQDLAAHFRNLVVMQVSQKPQQLIDMTESELAHLKEQAAEVSTATLQQFLHFLLRGEEEIRRSSNPKLVLEMTLLRLVQLPQVMDIGTIISQVQKLEQRISGNIWSAEPTLVSEKDLGPQVSSSDYPQAEKEQAAPVTVAESLITRWEGFLERIRQEKPALAASLGRADCGEPEPGSFELNFKGHEFDYEMVRESENFSLLSRLGRELFGERFRFSLNAGGGKGRSEKRVKTDRQRRQQQKALKHPLVTEALEIFGGEIVEVRIGPEKPK